MGLIGNKPYTGSLNNVNMASAPLMLSGAKDIVQIADSTALNAYLSDGELPVVVRRIKIGSTGNLVCRLMDTPSGTTRTLPVVANETIDGDFVDIDASSTCFPLRLYL